MIRVGIGYDVHRFARKRKLVLGGVELEYKRGLDGHSDADVLVHAVMDALLGAAALGDIGEHFPAGDAAYKGIDSCVLLEKVVDLLCKHDWVVGNIDAVIVAYEPVLAQYIPGMRKRIAEVCRVDVDKVSVKATSENGLGLAGRGIGAHSVCTILRKEVCEEACKET